MVKPPPLLATAPAGSDFERSLVAEPRGRESRIGQVVIINDHSIAQGGAGVLALQSARLYRRFGYRVTFITGQGPNAELEAEGIAMFGLGSRGLLELPAASAIRQGFHNGAAERLVAEWIARRDTPDTVYHLHNWSQILSPAVFRALRPVEERVIASCHDFFNLCPNGGLVHYGKSESCAARPLSLACIASQCDRRNMAHKYWRIARHVHLHRMARFDESRSTFVFIHQRMREMFVRNGFPARHLATIPNPASPWCRERIEAERNGGFLFVGRIGRDKGADLALEAARRAGQRITMVGSGELARDLAPRFPMARFTGWCAPGEIAAHASKARALIVPSRVIEPFGMVICEAALSGLPVIVSDRAYLACDVEAGGFGRAFSIADPGALAGMLEDFARDDAAVEGMSRAGFSGASSICHTPESWISAYLALFEEKLAHIAERAIPG